MSKIIPLDNNVPKKTIPYKNDINEPFVSFSFKFFDRKKTPEFNLAEVESTWYIDFLDALKDISGLTVKEFRNTKTYDLHDWSENSKKKYGFDIPGLNQIEQVQFRIDRSSGRIHGFLIDNIFYIVWLDPFHKMTVSAGYEQARNYDNPLSSYEKLSNEIKIKDSRIKQLEDDNKFLNEYIEKSNL